MVATEAPVELREPPVRVSTPSSRRRSIAFSVIAVWLSVGILSLFSPDLITGSEQDHLPIAALSTWLWGGLATGLILLAGAVGGDDRGGSLWSTFAAIVVAIWAIVAVAGVWSPVMITGTDPTHLPLAALLAPIAGAIGTAFACVYAAGSSRSG
jgi:hypothetical protein